MPTVNYYLATTGHRIDKNHPLWHQPLPERDPAEGEPSPSKNKDTASYDRYFSAVHRFCSSDGWKWVLQAASDRVSKTVKIDDLKNVSIFLEKHGAFYHPARIQVSLADTPVSFVVNVAVSEDGRSTMPKEVRALVRLNDERPFGWVPRVHSYDETDLPMFSGDWFEGYHEFHLTRARIDGDLAIIVWDGSKQPHLLYKNQIESLYRQAAMILTAFFDPITTDQVFPWHHAAGDFVIRIEKEQVKVRLITVRDYRPMLVSESVGIENERALLDAMVVFFIHLTVRMRLDRLDGVDDVVWAPDSCLAPMVDGFFQGLDLTARISGFPETFPEIFKNYFCRHDAKMLSTLANRITAGVFNTNTDTRRIIDAHLTDHIGDLSRILAI